MAGDSGYTTLTHYIDVEVFLAMIESGIKKLIHTYGDKNCGLRHEELCEEIKKIISANKKIVFQYMDPPGKKKWNSEWDSQRNGFFNKLFDEEGFINMCYPKNYKSNPSLYQLKSRHIQFCKEKDKRRSALGKSPEYNACKEYNEWIIAETASFTPEYLQNVSKYSHKTVIKYFSTKKHPEGYEPLATYRNSRLDCNKYNPSQKSHSQRPSAKEPPKSINPPTAPGVTQPSKEKNGKSLLNVDSESAKIKPDGNMPPKPKPSTAGSSIPSSTKRETDDAVNRKQTNVKAKGPILPIKRNGENKEATSIHPQQPTGSTPPKESDQTQGAKFPSVSQIPPSPPKDTALTPIIQSVPQPTTVTSLFPTLATDKDTNSSQTSATSSSLTITQASSLNSGSSSPSDPLLLAVVTKDQDTLPHSTITPVTSATEHSTQTLSAPFDAVPSLPQPQPPAMNIPPDVTVAQGPGTPPSSSASTVTITATTTTISPAADTSPTMNKTKEPISHIKQVPSTSGYQDPPPPSAVGEPRATAPITGPQQTFTQMPTSLSGSNTKGVSVQKQPDNNQQRTLSSAPSPKIKELIKHPGVQLSNSVNPHSGYTSSENTVIQDVKHQKTVIQADPKQNITPFQIRSNRDQNYLTPHVNANTDKIPGVRPETDLNSNSFTKNGKNYNSNLIPERISPLMDIIPTFLVILAAITLLFQLYKYTPFGFLLGRRKKRKKRDLRSTFVIPEESTYESPNRTVHELKDPNLVQQTVENDVYTKLLKINRYKQEMQKRKKKNKKTLIEVHMEVLEEYKNDEWELHKGDFLEICLRGFINEENDFYSNLTNFELTINNIKNEKTIEDIQKKEILWNNWIENHRNILEQWKKEDWFQNLKNEWKNEEQMYKEKNDKLQKKISNEQDTHSIVSQKEIWKQWILKQATLIDLCNKEDWFKSMVYAQDKEKDNYHINEYNNISLTSKIGLKHEKTNNEKGRSKNIIQKLMVQIHMMVLEECIKDEIIRNKELSIDNFIEEMHNNNNYDEKRNIPQCDTDDFNVLKYDEIHTSRNK